MTAAHEAVLSMAHTFLRPGWQEVHKGSVKPSWFTLTTGIDAERITKIIADLRARGEWPEGLRVVGEEKK
jgi:hypothetical protein